jgi:hypothetical protein
MTLVWTHIESEVGIFAVNVGLVYASRGAIAEMLHFLIIALACVRIARKAE